MPTSSIGTHRLEIYRLTLLALVLSMAGILTILPAKRAASARIEAQTQLPTPAGAGQTAKAVHAQAMQLAQLRARAMKVTMHRVERFASQSARRLVITTPPPEVAFTSTPPATTDSTSASFTWSSPTALWTHCDLDHAASTPCSGSESYSGLSAGNHTFAVAASRGGRSKTISFSWKVIALPAGTPPNTAPGTTSPAPATPATPPAGGGSTAGSGGSTGTPSGSGTSSGTGGSGGASTPPASPSSGGVAPPAAPSSYSVPAGAATVSTSAQLTAALSGSTAKDIVLADGTYDSSSPFSDTNGSHLYAQHLGGAVLTAGLVIGGNFGSGGGSVQGVAFNVSSASKTFNGGEVYVWGPAGQNARVLDSTFNGNGNIPVGLLGQDPGGLVAQRLTFTNFTDEGIRASNNQLVAFGGSTPVMNTITDISVNGVSRSTPGASDGTAESGVWIGEPVANGVHRIKIRNTAWSGIETCNNAWNTTFTDLDIDMSGSNAAHGVAVYLEHMSRNLVFDGFSITGASTGFNAEWDDGVAGNAAAHNVKIQNGTIDAAGWNHSGHTVGVFLDVGSDSTTVTGVTFKNQNWAAIGANQTIGTNTFSNNVYSVSAGASSVVNGHV